MEDADARSRFKARVGTDGWAAVILAMTAAMFALVREARMRRDGLWLAIDMAVASPTLLEDMPVMRTWDG